LEFEAECRFPRLARHHRPRSIPGVIAIFATLGFFVALAPLLVHYGFDTYAGLKDMATKGFRPETPAETRTMLQVGGRIAMAAFLFPMVLFIFWSMLKDELSTLGRKAVEGIRGTARGQVRGVHAGPMDVTLDAEAFTLASPVSHVTVRWPAVMTAALEGGHLVLTLIDGTRCRIAAGAAPGGPEAALRHAEDAMAGRLEAPA